MQPSNIKKVFVSSDNTAVVMCSHCGISKKIPVAQFKGKKTVLKIKCVCGENFLIKTEYRLHYRKPVKLPGAYTDLLKKVKRDIIVKDISRGGIGISLLERSNIKEEDKIRVEFRLDNAKKSLIRKEVIVRHADDYSLGGEFCTNDACDKELGFYLMP